MKYIGIELEKLCQKNHVHGVKEVSAQCLVKITLYAYYVTVKVVSAKCLVKTNLYTYDVTMRLVSAQCLVKKTLYTCDVTVRLVSAQCLVRTPLYIYDVTSNVMCAQFLVRTPIDTTYPLAIRKKIVVHSLPDKCGVTQRYSRSHKTTIRQPILLSI